MLRLVSVTSSRADVGILTPVWRACVATALIDLHVFSTGMHLTAAGQVEIPSGATLHEGGADLGGADAQSAGEAMAAITSAAAGLYARLDPGAVLVMGDRLDMLPAAIAALPFNLPLVHLHGGEITEGALDDRARHALTKLAHFHCVSSEGAERRLLAMGEERWRIVRTGGPGIDTLVNASVTSRREWLDAVGFADQQDDAVVRLVTVHPETNATDPAAPLRAVLSALDTDPRPTLFTAPNNDPGGAALRAMIDDFIGSRGWARFRDTLGAVLYPNALRHADVMLGNSSSGILEAGTFGLQVIDVGNRQKGRDAGENVVRVPADAAAVSAALQRLGTKPQRHTPRYLYGDGKAGPRVAAVLLQLQSHSNILRKQLVA